MKLPLVTRNTVATLERDVGDAVDVDCMMPRDGRWLRGAVLVNGGMVRLM
jgi:hypothetical protein